MKPARALIGFIGGGNMARAIVAGLLRAGHPADCILVADPDRAQREALARLSTGLTITGDNQAVAGRADVVLLAVKPQIMAEVAAALRPGPATRLFVSIAAGIGLTSLRQWLGRGAAIVRAMPNQPALVGAGMSVLTAEPGLEEIDRRLADYVLGAAGETGWVTDEKLLDAVTAVSGSGPAYYYLLTELLEDTARRMGIPAELATRLARQTAFGAGLSLRETDVAAAELRRQVTSPGGTTAAAVESLEAAGIRDIVTAALDAARKRSAALGARKPQH